MNNSREEANRIARLRELIILDSEPEPMFDSIVKLASEVCGVPLALVSLVDTERQWFKANIGLPGVNETPREVAFCAHAILEDELFEVPDAMQDARFVENPLVTDKPDIRFYAGAPLVLPGGERVGTLCVIDREVRRLDEAQKNMLRGLAKIATEALLARRDLITRSASVRSQYEQALADSESRYRAMVEEQLELVSLAHPDGKLVFVNSAYARHFGISPAQMVGHNLFDYIEKQDQPFVAAQIARVMETGLSQSNENRMVASDGSMRWVAWTNGLQRDREGRILLHSVGRDVTDRKLAEQALKTSKAALARTGRIAGVGGWQLDLATGELGWSDETRRIHEVPADFSPTLDSAVAFYAPEARSAIEDAVQRAIADGTPWDIELPLVTARGRPIWIRAQGEVELDNGQPVRLAGAFQDISERRQLQQRLADNERFLRQVTDGLPQRIAYLDRELRFRFVNNAFELWVGAARGQIVGSTMAEILGRMDHDRSRPWVERALAGESVQFERSYAGRGGATHVAVSYIPLWMDDGKVDGFVAVMQDISQHKQEEVRLLQLAQRDALTGLLNRAGFEQQLAHAVNAGDGGSLALLYIDLDHFKPINDQHGHRAGDEVLRQFAQRIFALVRPTDAVARLGGDEFAILLSAIPADVNARAIADKVIAAAQQPFAVDGKALGIGASVGVAFGVDAVAGWPDLVARADAMLYQAKSAGRGRQASASM